MSLTPPTKVQKLQETLHAKATLFTRSFDSFVTSTAVPIATGWNDQLPGGNRTH